MTNHARARAAQLHRQALRGPRKLATTPAAILRDRGHTVVPSKGVSGLWYVDDVPCEDSCLRLLVDRPDLLEEQKQREREKVQTEARQAFRVCAETFTARAASADKLSTGAMIKSIGNEAIARGVFDGNPAAFAFGAALAGTHGHVVQKLPLRDKPACHERCSPNIHWAGCAAYAYECALTGVPALPHPQHEPRCPAGWRTIYDDVFGTGYAADIGDEDNDDCPQVGPLDGLYVAWRADEPEQRGPFANVYAAMLCALGCEVARDPGSDGWHVTRPGDCKRWYGDAALCALVEQLTAERSAKGGAKAGRVFEWEHGPCYSQCIIGGLRAWYMHEGLHSSGVVAQVHGRPTDVLAQTDYPDSRSNAERAGWCEAQLNRLLDDREGKAR